ncbi:MAG: gamma-D-glutamyl-meso-diaminopimelate peptidase [Clostridiales bacterium]|nr:gamma-D-glutamyl-meso-diaminopimelate peptidase [Clostridiales bacterium]
MERIVRPRLPDYEALRSMIYSIKRTYPFVNCSVCGRTHAGRAIFVLSVGHSKAPVLMTGGFHAQEWLTTLLLLRFFECVCRCIAAKEELCSINIAGALHGRELIVIPCVNPDGVEIALRGPNAAGSYSQLVETVSEGTLKNWNANARGVDINHNFDAGWETLQKMEKEAGITGPSPRQYGGSMPESEPETAALTRLCRLRRPRHALAVHSQGEEIYWRFGECVPEGSEEMATLFAAASGYGLVLNDGLASYGGFKDWFIQEFKRPGFTIEIGKGKNPLPLEDFEKICRDTQLMLTLASIM